MSRPRRFDHDEARRLRADGWTYRAIADRLGVSPQAVAYACDERVRRAMNERRAVWQRSGVCEDCGGSCTRGKGLVRAADGVILCKPCRGRRMRTRFRYGDGGEVVEVRCVTCREWKPPAEFPSGSGPEGLHTQCSACGVSARTAYRAAHREADNAYQRERRRRLGKVRQEHVDYGYRCRDCGATQGRYHRARCSLRAELAVGAGA